MRPLPAADICRAVGGTFLQTGGGTVTGVTSDSRQIASGDLFIPLVGARFDGHDYIDTALSSAGHHPGPGRSGRLVPQPV